MFIVDHTTLEVFASDGLTYVPLAVIAKSNDLGGKVSVKGGSVRFAKLVAYKPSSIWK